MIIPLFVVIGVAAGVWVAGGEAADPRALALLFVVTLAGVAICSRAARNDPESGVLFQVLVLAWMARLVAMGIKLYIFYAVVGGRADAAGYHEAGEEIAGLLAGGQWPDLAKFWGTPFVELVTGIMYVVTGPTLVGGWIVFNFLGLLGMLLHYKAFVLAFPQGNRRLFMLLIFFAPTLLMWTNTVGKDALIAFFLGMAAYGAARLYARGFRLGSLLWTLAGIGGALLTRPHVGAILTVSLAAAVCLQPVRAGLLSPFIRLAMVAAVVAVSVVVVRTSASFISVENLSLEGVTAFAQMEGEHTQQGALAFEGGIATSPQGIGLALVTVPFRPFPWETANPLIFASSLEGLSLLGLLLYRLRNVGRAIAGVRRNPYLGFVLSFTLLFIIVFSTISNFGILIRQRAQLLPFLFVLLAFQGSSVAATSDPEDSADTN